ncbi:uncharacterized protein LOC111011279 [Momordica charantia]|uniref:Uncharacterized protein LOC111011279 n=1 Tax=Momordica charantia TaxID=3673 RepID=A0A6J1CHQ3_MOMCH|nr:uncharacterized protein LOC111011279 [Momordica charantia]
MEKENSVYSSIQIPHPLPSADDSGWTAYLLDDPSDEDAYSLGVGTSSLLSDAASHAAAAHLNIPSKLSLKPKPKPSQFFVDTSLEDTASSPHNSPKVADLGANNNYRRKSSLGKGRTMGEKFSINKSEEEINLEMGAAYTDLKQRGLCLVPLSIFANYLP